MTSNAGGLSRRRVGGGGGSTLTLGANGSSSSPSTSAPSNGSHLSGRESPSTPGPRPGQPPNEGGHKVAYDPRDLDTTSEERIMPKLTLMEDVLLLGLKDRQGYLSFWNDNISYTLRGCIVLELALRHRIAMVKDPNRKRFPLPDRYIEVVDERLTGEVLLDEALKMMKVSERMSVGTWIDLMSGETWNVMKIGYQLKQVRERLAKGLVDKGVLRTEKRNFLLFDMATHPVSDPTFKADVLHRALTLLTSRSAHVPASELYPEEVRYRSIRAAAMICAAFAANVLENALVDLNYDARELAFTKCDQLLAQYSTWPFGRSEGDEGAVGVGTGGNGDNGTDLAELTRATAREAAEGKELHLEIVAAVLAVFGKMDSLL